MELVLIPHGCSHVISVKNQGDHLIFLKILLRTCTIKDRIFFKFIFTPEDFSRRIFDRFKYAAFVEMFFAGTINLRPREIWDFK